MYILEQYRWVKDKGSEEGWKAGKQFFMYLKKGVQGTALASHLMSFNVKLWESSSPGHQVPNLPPPIHHSLSWAPALLCPHTLQAVREQVPGGDHTLAEGIPPNIQLGLDWCCLLLLLGPGPSPAKQKNTWLNLVLPYHGNVPPQPPVHKTCHACPLQIGNQNVQGQVFAGNFTYRLNSIQLVLFLLKVLFEKKIRIFPLLLVMIYSAFSFGFTFK